MDFSSMQKIEEGVYIKRGNFIRTKLIFPWKNEDGTINWFNFLTGGSWSNLVTVIVICLLVVLSVLAYKHDISSCVDALNYAVENPCEWCKIVQDNTAKYMLNNEQHKIVIPNITFIDK